MTGDFHVTGRRILATVIDLFLLGIAYRLLAVPLQLPLDISDRLNGTDGDFASRVVDNFPAILVYGAIAAVYYLVLESTWNRTVGKWVVGIRVVTDAGGRPGFGRVLVRTALRLVDGIGGYLVGFLIAIVNPRRRRLGDVVASTLVVRA